MIGFETPAVLLLIPLAMFIGVKIFDLEGLKRKIGFLNLITVILIILAISGPSIQIENAESETRGPTVFVDSSESSQLIKDWRNQLENENFNIKRFDPSSEGFEPRLKAQMRPGEDYIFVSDLQFESDLPQYFVENNISVDLIRPEMEDEAAVTINGPDRTVIGAENSFTVDVESTNDVEPEVRVGLEEDIVESGSPPVELDLEFDEEGYRNIWAEISYNDTFSENNRYYRAVKVREKPEIATVGQRGSLEDELSEFYNIADYSSMPDDPEEYEALIAKKPIKGNEIENYLMNGGGMMYTGDDYTPEYLPVTESESSQETNAPLIIFVIDISVSADESGATEAAKQIAYSLTEGLPDNSRVGLVAYNRYAYDMAEPELLATSEEDLQDKISRLKPEGPTFHNRGLRGARAMIEENGGKGNILMISDGKISRLAERNDVRRKSFTQASLLDGKLIAIGVGDQYPQEIDAEDKRFLRSTAERSKGGFYVDGHQSGKIELTFDAGGGTDKSNPIVISDSNHFITEDKELDGTVSQVNGVRPLGSASVLVSTSGGDPVLTTGRYGLGRVAAYSAGNPNLESLMASDPSLVGRTMSWVTGPVRSDEWVEGSRVTENIVAVSRTEKEGYSRQRENRYTRSLSYNGTGLYESGNLQYSVNYRPEIEEIGYNNDVIPAFTVNGSVYDVEDAGVLLDSVETVSDERTESVYLTPYILGAAILSYLGFVGMRKRNGMA
jgi:Mg-chelatase subunit ChlD